MSHFDYGYSNFQDNVPLGGETRHVDFNKTFSKPPVVIVCWAEGSLEDVGAYCKHLQVVRSSITTTGFDAGTDRLNGDGSWGFYYFAFESF